MKGYIVDESPDTVTPPLDGDGHNVTGLGEQPEPGSHAASGVAEGQEQALGDAQGGGPVVLATRRGYAFQASDRDVPLITSAGVELDFETALTVLEESKKNDGGVVVVSTESEED